MNEIDESDMTPLCWAAMLSDITKIKALLEQGADPNLRPALYYAMEYRCTPEIARTLLEAGADCNIRIGPPGVITHTILMRAVTNTDLSVVECLLEAGADPNIKEKYGRTPLMIAVQRTDADQVATALIRFGVDVNARDVWGKSVLQYAKGIGNELENGNKKVIDLLQRAGTRQ